MTEDELLDLSPSESGEEDIELTNQVAPPTCPLAQSKVLNQNKSYQHNTISARMAKGTSTGTTGL